MKKVNTYLADNEIDLRDFIKNLWKEKILILSISIVCGLFGYFYALSIPQQFKSEIIIKNPPEQIFELYKYYNPNNPNNPNNSNNPSNIKTNISDQFNIVFEQNFLSLDNLERFLEESKDFDNFKRYLTSRNISAKDYIANNFDKAKSVTKETIPNKYFLNHTKELDGATFLNKYAEFTRKKTIVEFKNILKLSLQNIYNNHQEALEVAIKVQLEIPFIKNTLNFGQVVTEPEALFYKGTKVLTSNINHIAQRLTKLENDQFDYDFILQKSITAPYKPIVSNLYFALGLMLGLFLSLGVIFFKSILNNS